MLDFSFNETYAMSIKAMRGVGYSWGVAQESANSVIWLCRQGFDGIAHLAGLLQLATDKKTLQSPQPIENFMVKGEASQPLCPILSGCYLLDTSPDMTEPLTFMQLFNPFLFLFFVAMMAEDKKFLGQVFSVRFDDFYWASNLHHVDKNHPVHKNDDGIYDVVVRKTPLVGTAPESVHPITRAVCDVDDWRVLERCAMKTYAPNTEISRLKGAG